jgi:hypothetical protein
MDNVLNKKQKNMKTTLAGQATPEQVSEWKAKHGDVFCVTIEGNVCYLKKPSRKALGYATMAGKENPVKFNLTRFCERRDG